MTFEQHAEHQVSDTINQLKAIAEMKHAQYRNRVLLLEDYAREMRAHTPHMCYWGDTLEIMLLLSMLKMNVVVYTEEGNDSKT